MRLLHSVAEMVSARAEVERPLGLVPTMGALHEGHLSLVRRARSENASLVVTIFVNPTQFAPNEDLAAYPRDPERDLALLASEGADVVFMPPPEEVYPTGYDTWISVERTSASLEGEARPGHFPRRGHRGLQDLQHGEAGQGVLRAEGRAAAAGHPQDERRPEPRRGGDGDANRSGTRRPCDEQPQRLPQPGRAPRSARAVRRGSRLRRSCTTTACGRHRPSARPCSESSQPSRSSVRST